MGTEVDIFKGGLPALSPGMMKELEEASNVTQRETVPSLSYEGKVWQVSLNGKKTKLTQKNAEGDEEPVSTMRVVILDWNKNRGRTYYASTYDPAAKAMPECWSVDGIKPDASIKVPQHATCTGCPMAAKGSKTTDGGKSTTACSQHRMIALIPAKNFNFEPLRMKIAITSDWDAQSADHEANNWYAYKNYVDALRARGISHTAQIVTKMRFDPNVAYPKILFSWDKLLAESEIAQLLPTAKSQKVKDLVGGGYTINGKDGVKVENALPYDDGDKEEPVKVEVDKTDAIEAARQAAIKAATVKKEAAAATAKKLADDKAAKKAALAAQLAALDSEDDGATTVVAAAPVEAEPKAVPKATSPKVAKPKPDAPVKADPAPSSVDAILDEWN